MPTYEPQTSVGQTQVSLAVAREVFSDVTILGRTEAGDDIAGRSRGKNASVYWEGILISVSAEILDLLVGTGMWEVVAADRFNVAVAH